MIILIAHLKQKYAINRKLDSSKDSYRVAMTCDAADAIVGRARDKKRPPPFFPTGARQLLQIEHLSNWDAPQCQQILV